MESEHSSSIPFQCLDSQRIPQTFKNFMKEDSEPFKHPNSEEIYYLDSKQNVSEFLREHSENRPQRSMMSSCNQNAQDAMIIYQSSSNQQQKKLRDLVDPSYLVKKEADSKKSEEHFIQVMAKHEEVDIFVHENSDIFENEAYLKQSKEIQKFMSAYQFLQDSYQLLQRYIFQRSQLPLFSIPFDFNSETQTLQNEGNMQSQFQKKKKEFCDSGFRKEFFMRFGVDLITSLEKSEKPHEKSLQLLISVRNNLSMIESQINYLNKQLKRNFQMPYSTCRICNEKFETGRQLGGHMSRKHPGRSREYRIKKQVREAKQSDRRRKNFFKSNYPHLISSKKKES